MSVFFLFPPFLDHLNLDISDNRGKKADKCLQGATAEPSYYFQKPCLGISRLFFFWWLGRL